MEKYLIVPIVKSPHMDSGRIGPKCKQDWYVGLEMAVKLHKDLRSSQIAVITDFTTNGIHEADIYDQALLANGIEDHLIYREGLETIGQIEAAKKIAEEGGQKLVLISTFLHRPRVEYYAGKGVLHRTAWGIPRPKEVIRDILMIPLAPIIRNFGLEERFMKRVTRRRTNGIL